MALFWDKAMISHTLYIFGPLRRHSLDSVGITFPVTLQLQHSCNIQIIHARAAMLGFKQQCEVDNMQTVPLL